MSIEVAVGVFVKEETKRGVAEFGKASVFVGEMVSQVKDCFAVWAEVDSKPEYIGWFCLSSCIIDLNDGRKYQFENPVDELVLFDKILKVIAEIRVFRDSVDAGFLTLAIAADWIGNQGDTVKIAVIPPRRGAQQDGGTLYHAIGRVENGLPVKVTWLLKVTWLRADGLPYFNAVSIYSVETSDFV